MDYKSVIESRYNRQNWQLLLHDIFGNKIKFWNTPSTIPTSSQFAKQALWLGTITLSDNQTISIYEVELYDSVDIERNRRGIRDMLLTDWRNNGNAGAFMFCYRKNESVLRFSYVSEAWTFADDGSYQKESTDAKRFTYLLGEGHRSRTAIQQFEKLRDSSLTLKDLTKAFSVDAVSDMFFDGYKKQYEDIIQYITGKRMVKVANKWEEQIKNDPCEEIMQEFAHFQNPEKAVRDYVKKLMGRLVFLQFLQKKGWLGVPAGAEWGTGDAEFIQTLFAQCQDKDHFVDDVLESLFNDLNSENEKQLPQYRTPYLNGGLFERDATDETEFPLPAKYVQSLLDFFASYNFTIDENDPDDAEVGVDPEMLGRIFENLLEDNKDKGAFYTPKEIVSYMCRESLIAYLQTGIEDEATKEAIRQFVTTYDVATLGANDRFRQQVDEALKNVKICDPAIGSGAFPMGLLKELFQCRTALEGISQHQAAEIKKHIIQQNIYGVDIERGAVDIARLRFWLSLIVDEETPQALPNLDFKIMQGNSLLEQYKGVDLSNITELKQDKVGTYQTTMFDDMLDVLRLDLRKKLDEYYSCTDHKRKAILKQGIINNVKQQIKEQSINVDFGDLNLSGNNQFMLWHTWFYDVFSQGGFDIVIANPPYVDAKKLKGIAPDLKQFKVFNGTADLYTYFYELAINMLTPNGIMTFITSNKWIRSEYGRNLRKMFLENKILQLIDFGRNRLFGATVDSNIISVKKNSKGGQPSLYYFDENTEGGSLLEMIKHGKVKNVDLSEDAWLLKAGENDKMKSKIESHGIPLKDLGVTIFRGILTGYNKAFHIDKATKEELIRLDSRSAEIIKPLICGGDTNKFYCSPTESYLIATFPSRNYKIDDFPAIKKHLLSYGVERLEQTGKKHVVNGEIVKSRKKTHNKWYETQDSISYWNDFTKAKIIWQAISKRIAFAYDSEGVYNCDVTTFFMTGNNLKYILAILNSKLFEYALLKIYLEGDTFKSKNAIIQNFPIPPINKTTDRLVGLVDSIISAKQISPSADISALESEIDRIVYQLYGLTEEEIKIVEQS